MLLETRGTRNLHYRIKSELIKPFRLSSVDLIKKDLPAVLNGYKIIQISDFHFGPCTPESHLRKAVSIVQEIQPDTIVLTGDYIQYCHTGLLHLLANKFVRAKSQWMQHRRKVRALARRLAEMLEPLHPPDGVFAVFGNHDHSEGLGTIRRQLKPVVHWLDNSIALIDKASAAKIAIAGVDDFRYGKPDLAKTFDALAAEKNLSIKILLSHNPDIVTLDQENRIAEADLVLCGHTHGGQICLPGGVPLVSRTKNRDYIAGMSEHKETAIYVNRGLGYGGISLRTFCPPEITLLTLKKP